MSLTFSGKTALLCGGNCDLAIGLAPLLIARGIRPVLSFRQPESKDRIAESLSEYSGLYDTCFLDFSESSSIENAFGSFDDGLDYLVDFVQEDYEELVSSADHDNVAHYFHTCITSRAAMLKTASRMMIRKRSGRLVFVSSAAAARPNPGQGFYAAGKLASEALYKNLGLELGRLGISTVCLRPGYIDAGRGRAYIEKNKKELIRKIPLNRFLNVSEVAETLLFLLSDQARAFNATELTMDGGFSAVKP